MFRTGRIVRSVFIVCVCTYLAMTLSMLSGCTSQLSSPEMTLFPDDSNISCVPSSGVPDFSGAWKDEFRRDYLGTQASLAKEVLCDGLISEAEAAEMNDLQRQCMEGVGLININIGAYGSMHYSVPAGLDAQFAQQQERKCETDTGWYPVIPLYNEVRTNPDHVDRSQLLAACLVRLKLRPAGYSGSDVDAEYDTGNGFSDIQDNPHFQDCLVDPLNAK